MTNQQKKDYHHDNHEIKTTSKQITTFRREEPQPSQNENLDTNHDLHYKQLVRIDRECLPSPLLCVEQALAECIAEPVGDNLCHPRDHIFCPKSFARL